MCAAWGGGWLTPPPPPCPHASILVLIYHNQTSINHNFAHYWTLPAACQLDIAWIFSKLEIRKMVSAAIFLLSLPLYQLNLLGHSGWITTHAHCALSRQGSRLESKVQPRRILETFNGKKICIAGHRHSVKQRASSSSTSRSLSPLEKRKTFHFCVDHFVNVNWLFFQRWARWNQKSPKKCLQKQIFSKPTDGDGIIMY